MSWGYNPYISEKDPCRGAYLAVIESVSKLIATGAAFEDVYLTFQEYFERLRREPARWGKPLAALLGAFAAQMALGIGAVGGKDSMSGSFEQMDVPPTLVSFAVTTEKTGAIVSNECKRAGDKLVLLAPAYGADGLPETVHALLSSGKAVAAYTPGFGGAAEAALKMCIGNGFGCRFEKSLPLETLFGYRYGAFVLEVLPEVEEGTLLGYVTEDGTFSRGAESVACGELFALYEKKLENVYPTQAPVRPPSRRRVRAC